MSSFFHLDKKEASFGMVRLVRRTTPLLALDLFFDLFFTSRFILMLNKKRL